MLVNCFGSWKKLGSFMCGLTFDMSGGKKAQPF
jgi:hypothetical protein